VRANAKAEASRVQGQMWGEGSCRGEQGARAKGKRSGGKKVVRIAGQRARAGVGRE
jgi:hypothetical protein